MLNHTCILYFARNAREELKYKRLASKKAISLKIIQKLQHNTIATIASSGLPYVFHLSTDQKGDNFSQKLSHAIDRSFKSYKNVIVVGYDCPLLSKEDLLKAAQNLENGKNTIGGDKNGGAYLIGIQKKSWRLEDFENLAWQTNELFDQLTTKYFEKEELSFLSSKIDFNSAWDIFKAQSFQYLSSLIKVLLQLIQIEKICSNQELITVRQRQTLNIKFRGPPFI